MRVAYLAVSLIGTWAVCIVCMFIALSVRDIMYDESTLVPLSPPLPSPTPTSTPTAPVPSSSPSPAVAPTPTSTSTPTPPSSTPTAPVPSSSPSSTATPTPTSVPTPSVAIEFCTDACDYSEWSVYTAPCQLGEPFGVPGVVQRRERTSASCPLEIEVRPCTCANCQRVNTSYTGVDCDYANEQCLQRLTIHNRTHCADSDGVAVASLVCSYDSPPANFTPCFNTAYCDRRVGMQVTNESIPTCSIDQDCEQSTGECDISTDCINGRCLTDRMSCPRPTDAGHDNPCLLWMCVVRENRCLPSLKTCGPNQVCTSTNGSCVDDVPCPGIGCPVGTHLNETTCTCDCVHGHESACFYLETATHGGVCDAVTRTCAVQEYASCDDANPCTIDQPLGKGQCSYTHVACGTSSSPDRYMACVPVSTHQYTCTERVNLTFCDDGDVNTTDSYDALTDTCVHTGRVFPHPVACLQDVYARGTDPLRPPWEWHYSQPYTQCPAGTVCDADLYNVTGVRCHTTCVNDATCTTENTAPSNKCLMWTCRDSKCQLASVECPVDHECNTATGVCEGIVDCPTVTCPAGSFADVNANCECRCDAADEYACRHFDNSAFTGTCNPNTRLCMRTPRPCDDGDGCTVGDVSLFGICFSGTPVTCPDRSSLECGVGKCVSTGSHTYQCQYTPDHSRCASYPCNPAQCGEGGFCDIIVRTTLPVIGHDVCAHVVCDTASNTFKTEYTRCADIGKICDKTLYNKTGIMCHEPCTTSADCVAMYPAAPICQHWKCSTENFMCDIVPLICSDGTACSPDTHCVITFHLPPLPPSCTYPSTDLCVLTTLDKHGVCHRTPACPASDYCGPITCIPLPSSVAGYKCRGSASSCSVAYLSVTGIHGNGGYPTTLPPLRVCAPTGCQPMPNCDDNNPCTDDTSARQESKQRLLMTGDEITTVSCLPSYERPIIAGCCNSNALFPNTGTERICPVGKICDMSTNRCKDVRIRLALSLSLSPLSLYTISHYA